MSSHVTSGMVVDKPQPSHVEELKHDHPFDGPVMRTTNDDLSIWQSFLKNKLVSFVAFSAAFCASLDGYQITLNGGVVSNKGFIKQFAGGVSIIPAKYVSAWGGIQSAGQTIGQIFIQFVTESFGRKPALLTIWVMLVISVFIESFALHWYDWLVAKLFSGMGVGMLQATMPVYLSEIAPTQLKGFFIDLYSLWFIVGQLFGAVALNEIGLHEKYDFRLAIYTQWAMIGLMGIAFVLLPESPWWLCGKSKADKAAKVLSMLHGHNEDYNVHEVINVMSATVETEAALAQQSKEVGIFEVFQGRNFIRFIIASWPKITQQLVGLTIFNTYATYFFQDAGFANPFLVTVILTCVQLISALITSCTTDALGRRPLTVYPYAITSLSLLSLGIVGCFDYRKPSLSSLLIFFACLATFTTTGASAIGYAYAAEVPAQRIRARTTAWALALSNMVAIIFSFCTPLMLTGSADWGVKTAFFFAAAGAVAVVIAWFIMPEVTKRTPAEIDELFEKRVSLRKFDKYVTEVQMNAVTAHEKGGGDP